MQNRAASGFSMPHAAQAVIGRDSTSRRRSGLTRPAGTRPSTQVADGDTRAASGYWRLAWGRLRRDPLAMASGTLLLLVFAACFIGAPLLAAALGHGPDTIFSNAVQDFRPVGLWTRVPNANYTGEHVTGTTLMVLGADGTVGRDELLRLLYGGQATIEVALGATLIGVTIGSTWAPWPDTWAAAWTASSSG